MNTERFRNVSATRMEGVMDQTIERSEGYERRWWILGVLCLSLLVIGLDNTILNVALPTLVRDLNATDSQLQWIVDAYVLVFAGLLLTAGSLSDRFGRRSALGLGLLIFGAGSVASAFATSANMLIGTRALMGVGGAFIMPSTLSILTNVFPPSERGRAIGIWAGVSGLGIGLGPVVGGLLLNHFWWGSVFLVNVPIVIFAFVAGRLIVPNSKDPAAPRVDPLGVVLSISGLVTLVYAIIEAPNHGWTDPVIMLEFAVATVLLGSFVWWELRTDHPMLNVRFFENPRFTAANVSITLVFFALFGSLFFLTQYLQFILGYTPLQAGLRTAPIALVIVIVAPITGLLVHRLGNKVLVCTGMAAVAVGLFLMSRLTGSSGYGHVLESMIILATGMSLAMTPATESVMGSLPKDKAGVGSAMNDTTRQIGGALGVAVLGSVFTAAYSSGLTEALTRIPAQLAADVESSVGAALGVARSIGGSAGRALAGVATDSFIDAMSRALVLGSLVALAGALVSLIWLPNRAEPDAAERRRIAELDAQHGEAHDGEAPQPQPVREGITAAEAIDR
jgi:EmrB/QacA subfamily drug resistance transporter